MVNAWDHAMNVGNGGYMRLEDYCNSGGHGLTECGNGLHYTSGVILFEEEVDLLIECGERVTNYVLEMVCCNWDALMDLHYAEYCINEQNKSKIVEMEQYPWQKEQNW